MTSDEVISVVENKSVIFEGEKSSPPQKKNTKKNQLIQREDPVGTKITLEVIRHKKLFDLNLPSI